MSAERFDYIICGGGSAGCVLANRLSSNPDLRVLLLEAGADYLPGTEPASLRDRGVRAIMLGDFFWPDLVHDVGDARVPYLSPRIIGGGSSINGMHAQRGLPRDYAEWQTIGVSGWNWEDVLPYFKRLESDHDFSGPMHGKDGPIGIRRVPVRDWSPFTLAVHRELLKEGIPELRDFNAEDGDGVAPTPLNNDHEARVSTAIAYLTSSVRARKNLQIRSGSAVRRVLFEGGKAHAVEIEGQMLHAREVIVSAGAIHSPALLMRSGVGPAATLRDCGIDVVCDRPGVGRNLRNHPFFSITCHLRPAGRQHRFRVVRQPAPMIARYSSKHDGCESTDMALNLWERLPAPLADDPFGRQLALMMVLLNKSHSKGEITLDSAAPFAAPRIRGNILQDPDDVQRMVDAFVFVSRIAQSSSTSQFVDHCFVDKMALGAVPDPIALKILQDNRRARMLSGAVSFAMDHIPGVLSKTLKDSGPSVESILSDPERLPELVRKICNPGGHPIGTCRMGGRTDLHAVTDSSCRVIGIDGLRVVDASVFPTPLTAGTNLPVIMAAEKISDLILRGRNLAPA